MDDGDRLLLFRYPGRRKVRALLFHGLSGNVNAEYMRRTAAALHARDIDVWSVNHRGCGEGAGLAQKPYHSGKTEDLQAVLQASRADDPDVFQLVIGFSLSGNLALLHATQDWPDQPDGIIAVNPPVDLERASIDIGRGWNRVYEIRFMWRLSKAIRERQLVGLLDPDYRVPLGMSLIDFDDYFTAPTCGFDSGLDYYRKSSSFPHLAKISTPTVILSAEDDPFVHPDMLRNAKLSASSHLHLEPTGGHVGYVTRGRLGWDRWLDEALVHYAEQVSRTATPRPV